jgi:hypothetical protein
MLLIFMIYLEVYWLMSPVKELCYALLIQSRLLSMVVFGRSLLGSQGYCGCIFLDGQGGD